MKTDDLQQQLLNSYHEVVRDVIENWNAPIVYLKRKGYLPNNFEDTSHIKVYMDELMDRIKLTEQEAVLRKQRKSKKLRSATPLFETKAMNVDIDSKPLNQKLQFKTMLQLNNRFKETARRESNMFASPPPNSNIQFEKICTQSSGLQVPCANNFDDMLQRMILKTAPTQTAAFQTLNRAYSEAYTPKLADTLPTGAAGMSMNLANSYFAPQQANMTQMFAVPLPGPPLPTDYGAGPVPMSAAPETSDKTVKSVPDILPLALAIQEQERRNINASPPISDAYAAQNKEIQIQPQEVIGKPTPQWLGTLERSLSMYNGQRGIKQPESSSAQNTVNPSSQSSREEATAAASRSKVGIEKPNYLNWDVQTKRLKMFSPIEKDAYLNRLVKTFAQKHEREELPFKMPKSD
ncbi:uncharacterized protein LOC115633849 [Scaptodrosophila lebanonensis]|uniref:Uncharacterized protein LOC115633849 n=1 Tax=Drosophila lebanonensis TaxID=7225 RepID=A0A6J2UFG7_DROLE|nr:uncharacterized protein LOC115633849 [Scaptodrosophila lebanonensis]